MSRDPITATATATVTIGRAVATSPAATVAALLVLGLLAVNAAAIVSALVTLLAVVAALVVALLAARVYLAHRREQWHPFAGDVQINTGPRALAGRACAGCLPVRIPATAVLLGADGSVLAVCGPHLHAARTVTRRSLPRGGAR
jgi:hypothetical protein